MSMTATPDKAAGPTEACLNEVNTLLANLFRRRCYMRGMPAEAVRPPSTGIYAPLT